MATKIACDFCGKKRGRDLIAGKTALICNVCVERFARMFAPWALIPRDESDGSPVTTSACAKWVTTQLRRRELTWTAVGRELGMNHTEARKRFLRGDPAVEGRVVQVLECAPSDIWPARYVDDAQKGASETMVWKTTGWPEKGYRDPKKGG